MAMWEFQVLVSDMSDEIANRLFESGCDDNLPVVSCGVPAVWFSREASTFAEAVTTGIRDIEAAGVIVKEVKLEDDAEVSDAITSVVETANAMLSHRVGA